MASRPILSPYSVVTNGDMSGNITSKVSMLQNVSMLSYSIKWAGSSPVGAITVEVSNDYSQDASGAVANPGTWNELPLSDTTDISGNSGKGFIDIDAIAGLAVRLVYTRVSGTGTLNVMVNGKVA